MPTFCLSVYSLAVITRMTRSNLLEVLGEDFVRTARAKGMGEFAVLFRHVMQNALIPVTTVIGLQFGYMLGGAVITETDLCLARDWQAAGDGGPAAGHPGCPGGSIGNSHLFCFCEFIR